MNDPSAYWTDGSYFGVYNLAVGQTIPSPVNIGTGGPGVTGFYTFANHTAIVTTRTTFTSKWGSLGLYKHPAWSSNPYTSAIGISVRRLS